MPPWRMPKISEEQPLAPSALRRHVAPVVQRKTQAEEAQQQEQAEQAQEVLPVFPDWGPDGDTTGMNEITCDTTEPPTDGEETLPKRAKTEQAEIGPCSDARSGQAGAGRAQRSDAAAGRPLRSDARSSQSRAGRAQRSDAAAGRGRPLCFDARAAGADGSGIAAAGAEKEEAGAGSG